MKVMIVDDELINQYVTKDMLMKSGIQCEIIVCSSPTKALEVLKEQEIDILFLDIVMPEMTGIDVLKILRSSSQYNSMRIIMFTSLTDKKSYMECFNEGADDFIHKPIDQIELISRFKSAVNTRQNTLMLKEMIDMMRVKNNELRRLTTELKEAQFQMIQKEKMASLGELSAGIAHEINNPIGFVASNMESMKKFTDRLMLMVLLYRNFTQTIEKGSLSRDELNQHLREINAKEKEYKLDFIMDDFGGLIDDSKQGIDRVAKIVRSLKDFSRSGLEESKGMEDFNNIIEEALLISGNQIKYIAEVIKDVGDMPLIYCDKGQLTQVLVNLFVNAAQAIKGQNREEKGKIWVKTFFQKEYVYCIVKDDGPGIHTKDVGKVFDPFFTTKEVGMGTGLGLSISYDIIVNKHKGEIFVSEKSVKGAEFTIKLPYQVEENKDE